MGFLLRISGLLAVASIAAAQSSITHYRTGQTFVNQRNYQSAANEFRSALSGDQEPKWTVVWSHIQLGRIFDATGQHERAANEYRLAERTQDNTDGALEEVRKYLSSNSPPRTVEFPPRKAAFDFSAPVGVYPLSKDVTGPEVIEKRSPEYTEEARIAQLEGTVLVTGVVDANGTKRDMKVTGPLARIVFGPSEGLRILRAAYPAGADVSKLGLEEASLVAAIRRQATTTLSFEIDELGTPVNFRVDDASEPQWGDEAIAFVREWKFTPGSRNVPCMLILVWGERKIDAGSLEHLLSSR